MEIRWGLAHNGAEGNVKTDEWAKVAVEEPDICGLEWLNWTEVCPMP